MAGSPSAACSREEPEYAMFLSFFDHACATTAVRLTLFAGIHINPANVTAAVGPGSRQSWRNHHDQGER